MQEIKKRTKADKSGQNLTIRSKLDQMVNIRQGNGQRHARQGKARQGKVKASDKKRGKAWLTRQYEARYRSECQSLSEEARIAFYGQSSRIWDSRV